VRHTTPTKARTNLETIFPDPVIIDSSDDSDGGNSSDATIIDSDTEIDEDYTHLYEPAQEPVHFDEEPSQMDQEPSQYNSNLYPDLSTF